MHAGILNIRLDIQRTAHWLPDERLRRIATGLTCAGTFAPKASALCLSAMLASASGYKYDTMILATAIPGVIAIAIAILRSGAIELNKQPHMPAMANAMIPSRDCERASRF
jgi:hypothetical protein